MPRPNARPAASPIVRVLFILFAAVGALILLRVVFDIGSQSAGGTNNGDVNNALFERAEREGALTQSVGANEDIAKDSRIFAETETALAIASAAADVEVPTAPKIQFTHRGDMGTVPSGCAPAENINTVVLAGNRPVGTYLCEYFPNAPRTHRGCTLNCELSHRNGGRPFACEIYGKASQEELFTADIVVNHFGPVPSKKNGRPYISMFYQGESKAADGKRALATYLAQYDRIVSFSRDFKHTFTWVHRHLDEFTRIYEGGAPAASLVLGGSLEQWSAERKSAIAIFVSRCKKGGRDLVIRKLAEHYTVHSFGKCARTHRIADAHPDCAAINKGRYAEKACVFRKYKFVLALDNTRELDYVTEKVYHALLAGAIPVYDGAPNVGDVLPGGTQSVIMLQDFRKDMSVPPALGDGNTNNHDVDFAALAAHLRAVEANATLRAQYTAWRERPAEVWAPSFLRALRHPEPTCEVCADALEMKRCAAANGSG